MPEAEETLICHGLDHGVADLTTSQSMNKLKDASGSTGIKADVMNTYLLEHVKYDFYKKAPDLLTVVVYVKEIDNHSLEVKFETKDLHLKFQTRCNEFLKLHNQVPEETIFEWNVHLRHTVDIVNCKYDLSKTKLTMTLKRACVKDQWNSFEELNVKGAGGDKLMNGGGHLNIATGNKVAKSNKANNDNVNLGHCNGKDTNCSNKNQTVGKSNQNVVNGNNNKDCEHEGKSNGLDNNSKDVILCNGTKSLEKCSCYSTTKERNVECTRHLSQQDPSSTSENNYQTTNHACKSNGTDLGSVKVSNRNTDQVLDESCEKDNKTNKYFKLSYDAKKHDCRPGSVGLVNSANLCYINSVVQCLSSVIELRTCLLSKKHCVHINCDNKSGYQGELISTFDCLMQELWSGKERYVSASKLKYILGKKHKQFMHYGQGDAQEFLTFLLDGLHESFIKQLLGMTQTTVNRIYMVWKLEKDLKQDKKKSLREIKNDDSKDILEGSRLHWEKFINGNYSIVSDLFQGQSVSEVRCKECTKPSTGFDHWMQLNLPIPDDPKYLSVYVFFLDPEKKPLKTKLKVCQRTRCSDLLSQLNHHVDVSPHCLVLLRSQYSRISHIFDPIEDISSNNDILIACEIVVPEQDVSSLKTKQECGDEVEDIDVQCDPHILHISVIQCLYQAEKQREIKTILSKGTYCFYLTLTVISLIKAQRLTHRVTSKCSCCENEISPKLLYCSNCLKVAYCNRDCQRKAWKGHRQYCKFQPLIIGTPFIMSVEASKATLDEIKKKALHYARYSVAPQKGELESSKSHLTLLENLTDFNSKGIQLTEKGDTPVVDENVCLALDWDATTSDSKVISKDLVCNIHDTVNETRFRGDNTCSLEECLKLYWNLENINKECGWRCDHCKEVRAATRKVMICKHPDNLIIHIKRFSYFGNGRKISKHIQFPLRDLDMSPFTHPEITTDAAIYDLRAVSSHYGVMNFGHYIAYCKPYSEEELDTMALTNTDGWLRYDDSKVDSVEETETKETQAYILFYHRRNATSFSEQSAVATESEDTLEAHPETMQECLDTSLEVPMDNILDSENTSSIQVEEHESASSHVSSDCATTNCEILLEEQLD